MKIPIFQINAFTQKPFSGNPAAVCPLQFWLPDDILQGIAKDNNLSETAFFVSEPEGLHIRWFTPAKEVSLCGHATLATSYVWFSKHPEATEVQFQSLSGMLTVIRNPDGSLTLDFPSREGTKCESPTGLEAALGVKAVECFRSIDDILVVVESEEKVRSLGPDLKLLKNVEARGVIVSAPGVDCDVVSRFFAPRVGVDEDPVTGSAHCVITPFWAKRLQKNQLKARQLSARGGELLCELTDTQRVRMTGHCVPYMEGQIQIKI